MLPEILFLILMSAKRKMSQNSHTSFSKLPYEVFTKKKSNLATLVYVALHKKEVG